MKKNATVKHFLFSPSHGRRGNSEPGKFSLSVILLAHAFEMFILERYALTISVGSFIMVI